MSRRRLIWTVFPAYLLVILGSLVAVSVYASRSLSSFYHEQTREDLLARAQLIAEQVRDAMAASETAGLDELCQTLGAASATRITVILPTGEVIGDTEGDVGSMDNHANRPEIEEALRGSVGMATRFSHTLRRNMMYVAVPVAKDGVTVGVVRTALALTSVEEALNRLLVRVVLGGVVVALLAGAVSLVISRRIAKPLEQMKRGAERFAQGDLGHKLRVPASQEIGGLAEALNQMASQLDDRLMTVIQQHNELDAVLSSMVEGVFAVDSDERILSMNKAAGRLFHADPFMAQGRLLSEVIRNPDLEQFVAEAMESTDPVEREITLRDGAEQFLQVHGAVLRNAQGDVIGLVVVLNDVSHLRQVEQVRRDFVANVSHEIRTPVTSIKGYVETLLDGALSNGEDTRRFLGIVLRQADRLIAIIEDLLTLARVEQTDKAEIILEPRAVRDVLTAAVQACESGSMARDIRVTLECDRALQARINTPLLEQAVINLLTNAIKYSEPGSLVEVRALPQNGGVVISVRDHGCGIEREHLARLFERFYRVDKARSRNLGGTGLGLAIVKHITQAHGGSVHVESEPGVGSVFALHLPALDEPDGED